MAQGLKEEIEKTKPFKEAFLRDPESTHIPTDEDKFLEYLCSKHLNLKSEDGLPLLKEAFKQQYDIEDEYKLCNIVKNLSDLQGRLVFFVRIVVVRSFIVIKKE